MMLIGYLLMCFIFGTTYLAIKIGLSEGLPPLYMASLRFFIASLVLGLFLMLIKKSSYPKGIKLYLEMAYLGILMTTIPFAALFWAEQHISSGIASLLVATAPLFIGLLSRMDRLQWLGFFVALTGLYLVLYQDIWSDVSSTESLMAKGAIVLSELFFAYGAIRSKKLLSTGLSPQWFNSIQMGFASLALFLASLLIGERPFTFTQWTPTSIASLLYLAIVASVLASGIYYWLIHVTNPLFPSTWTYVAPIIALSAGSLLMGEAYPVTSLAGTIFVLSGVVIINRKVFLSLLPKKRSAETKGHLICSEGEQREVAGKI
ncbi:DMT family transporter [Ammoniphilus sp. CFH 90114]|uniref:DMT family transporter n=1 Tax=Ammoniphilus sp. CFH 90114 TaxID=2493665 RepID=UPI00100DCEFF|nr:EamA family transporter [Ammoniphilus sp. CFH 90114]RXT03636.1 hypothetical protein EIZ39_23715 [Ammoniphilus sp. CFH 90114]